jgi:hypothetical protein
MGVGCHSCLFLCKERTFALLSFTSSCLLVKHCQNPEDMCAGYQVRDFQMCRARIFLCYLGQTLKLANSDPKILTAGSGKTAAFVLPLLTYISKLPPMTEEIEAEGTLPTLLLYRF